MRKILITFTLLLITCCCTMAQVKSVQADFTQTKTMKMLGDKMVSKGKMSYTQGKLHWEYTQPHQMSLDISGQKATMTMNGQKKVMDMNGNNIFKEIGKVMASSVAMKGKGQRELPLTKEMKALYTKVVVYYNAKTSLADRVMMYEKEGDTTEIRLTNVKVRN